MGDVYLIATGEWSSEAEFTKKTEKNATCFTFSPCFGKLSLFSFFLTKSRRNSARILACMIEGCLIDRAKTRKRKGQKAEQRQSNKRKPWMIRCFSFCLRDENISGSNPGKNEVNQEATKRKETIAIKKSKLSCMIVIYTVFSSFEQTRPLMNGRVSLFLGNLIKWTKSISLQDSLVLSGTFFLNVF